MTAEEKAKFLEETKRLHEEFKKENNLAIAEAVKGRKDPLLEEKIDRMNTGLDTISARMEKLEARPN